MIYADKKIKNKYLKILKGIYSKRVYGTKIWK